MTDREYPAYIDRRDAAVVEQLSEGQEYNVQYITSLYKTYTDIRKERTAKQRKKNLVQSPAFECVGIGRFVYTGVDQQ
jgi:DNA-dependent RNA polymerase auxiliary subunit epsilon